MDVQWVISVLQGLSLSNLGQVQNLSSENKFHFHNGVEKTIAVKQRLG